MVAVLPFRKRPDGSWKLFDNGTIQYTTGNTGKYRLEVPVGRYKVLFYNPNTCTSSVQATPSSPANCYANEWLGNTTLSSQSPTIRVTQGDTAAGLDITLPLATPLYGSTNPEFTTLPFATAYAVGEPMNFNIGNATSRILTFCPNACWANDHLAPGEYYLRFSAERDDWKNFWWGGTGSRATAKAITIGTEPVKLDVVYERAPKLTSVAAPTISGGPRVGTVLKSSPGTWVAKPQRLTYKWYRDGRRLYRSNVATLKVIKTDVGHRLKVKVTAYKRNYQHTSATSAPTRVIRPAR